MNAQIPQGIEVLVKKASVDSSFRGLLLERRAAAAKEIGLELDAAEALMLSAATREQLEAIIAQTDVPQDHRRAFLGYAAAAMLAMLGLSPTNAVAWGGDTGKSKGPRMSAAGGGMRMDRPEENPKGSPRRPTPKPKPKTKEYPKPKAIEQPKPKPKRPGTIEERVLALVAEQFKADEKALTREISVSKDLKAGFSAQVKLKKNLEEEFDIKIPGETFKKLEDVGKIIDHVRSALEKDAAETAETPKQGKPSGVKPSNPPSPISRGIRPD